MKSKEILNSIKKETISFVEFIIETLSDSCSLIWRNKVKIYCALVAMMIFHAVYFFAGIQLIAHLAEKYNKAPPALKNKNELTGNEYPLISLAKACSYDGGCTKTVILFSSKINSVSAKEFSEFVKSHPSVDAACFRSSGGMTKELETITKTIRDKPLSTCMADYYRRIAEPGGHDDNAVISGGSCSSACNTALLSSKTRLQIGTETYFRGHATGVTKSAKMPGVAPETVFSLSYSKNVDSSELKAFIKAANTPHTESHLRYIEAVENINHLEEMKTLNRSELLEYRIFTHQCDGFGNCNPIVIQPAKQV